MKARFLLPLLALLAVVSGGLRADAFVVFAAASMKTVLDELAGDFETQTGTTAAIAYAGSSVLARQILQGAPADLFISANIEWMDELQAAGAIRTDTRFDLTGNRLVLIASAADTRPIRLTDPTDWHSRMEHARIAMALVDAVPAGKYGKAALAHLGYWDDIAPQVVQTDNARTALALVARGETAFGIVYASDAVAEPRVTVVATFPAGSHPPIRYPAALTARSEDPAALAFLRYLQRPQTRDALMRHGFAPLTE